jgi:hypothetical protein
VYFNLRKEGYHLEIGGNLAISSTEKVRIYRQIIAKDSLQKKYIATLANYRAKKSLMQSNFWGFWVHEPNMCCALVLVCGVSP